MNMENTTDIRVRNINARQNINKISKDNGISFTFIARQMNTSPSSFSHWKGNKYEYSLENLNKVESIIKKYSFND